MCAKVRNRTEPFVHILKESSHSLRNAGLGNSEQQPGEGFWSYEAGFNPKIRLKISFAARASALACRLGTQYLCRQMHNRRVDISLLRDELRFSTSRSGGPGGQHVNKVETKVSVKLDVRGSAILTAEEKQNILTALSRYMTKDGILSLSVQESRSQFANKEAVLLKLNQLLAMAFVKKKTRSPTKPSRSSKMKRLSSKKAHAEKKKWRQKP